MVRLKNSLHVADTVNGAAFKKTGGIRKPHRWRSGTVALREIRRLQRSTDLLIRKKPFDRLVREIAQEIPKTAANPQEWRFKKDAIAALQTAAEDMLVELFDASNDLSISEGRVTLLKRHFVMTRKLKERFQGRS
jgi:histone H3